MRTYGTSRPQTCPCELVGCTTRLKSPMAKPGVKGQQTSLLGN